MKTSLSYAKTKTRPADASVIALFLTMVLTTFIAVPLFGWFYGYSLFDWVVFAVLYVFTGLGITVGYHRLISHRSFSCHKSVKFILLIAGGWAFQNSALKWSSDHVRHHARVDKEEDPYNAKKGFWHSHVMWVLTRDPHKDEKYAAQFRKDPLVVWQDRYYIPVLLSGFAFPFVAGFIYNGWMGGVSCFLLGGVARAFLVLNSTFCINSVCHLWGDQPHGKENTSRDSWLVSLITFGEGYHNFHHRYPRDYRNGPYWYNFDPSKWLIFGLATSGLASDLFRAEFRTA